MRRLSFTLVEVLVVVATIALLVGILLPCLLSTQQHSKVVACTSNVRQLALGLIVYEGRQGTFPHAWDNTIEGPPPGGYPGDSAFDRRGWWWFNHVIDYSRRGSNMSKVLWCPARRITSSKLKYNVLCGNYGVNVSICKSTWDNKEKKEFVGTPLRAADIPHPSNTILVVDSGYSMISWWHATNTPPVALSKNIEDTAYIPSLCINKDRVLWSGQELDAIEGRHANKSVNVGYADGHVSSVGADYLSVEQNGDAYRNLRPLWVPK